MNIDTAVAGMLDARHALQKREGVSSPTYISEQMQRLAQYTSAIEERLAELEEDLENKESELFKKYRSEGKSVNASEKNIKYDIAEEKARIIKLTRYASSSWKLISVSQSRIKHLIAEANNQV